MNNTYRRHLSVLRSESDHSNNKIVWSAIFAGTIVSLGFEILFNFLGIGLGLASLNPKNLVIFNLETGAIIWLAVSGMLSMGLGGLVVGKFSNITCAFGRGYHGIIAWALATLLTIAIATSASGAFIGGAINMINPGSLYALAQTETNTQRDVTPLQHEQFSNINNVDDKNKQMTFYIENVGKASIMIFIAFFMSAVSSVLGSLYGGQKIRKFEDLMI